MGMKDKRREGKRGYLHYGSTLFHRHAVPPSPDEMKTLIIEKSKMGVEEEPELLVKGKCDFQSKQNVTHLLPETHEELLLLSH